MKRLIILGLSLLVTQFAIAQQCQTLTYVGAPFTSVTTTGENYTPISGPLAGTITLMAPLTPNMTNVTVPVAAWDFSTEYAFLNSTDSPPSIPWDQPTFIFTTDANGNIIDWQTTLKYFLGPGTQNRFNITATSNRNGDSVSFDVYSPSEPNGPATIVGDNTVSGTWTCQTEYTTDYQAPPKAPVPAPINPLTAQVSALTGQITTLTTQNASLTKQAAQVTPLNTKVSALTTQLATMTKQAAQVTPLTTKVTTLTAQLVSMTNTSASWNAKYVAAEKALVAANATIAKLNTQMATIKLAKIGR